MQNEYPRMMYKHPGREEMHGSRFDTLIVTGEDDQEAAMAEGWALTTTDAVTPPVPPTQAPTSAPTAAPTPEPTEAPTQAPVAVAGEDEQERSLDRDALKAQAIALGLEFPKNVPTDRLREMIAEASAKE